MGNLQYSFSMDQLEKLEEVHSSRMRYSTDIKDKYQFDLIDWLCSEKSKKKINLMNKKLTCLISNYRANSGVYAKEA